ncbi:MAG: hypothetical protein U1E41_01785 [Paracoccus sp. (in: a-proteobacteria)]
MSAATAAAARGADFNMLWPPAMSGLSGLLPMMVVFSTISQQNNAKSAARKSPFMENRANVRGNDA